MRQPQINSMSLQCSLLSLMGLCTEKNRFCVIYLRRDGTSKYDKVMFAANTTTECP